MIFVCSPGSSHTQISACFCFQGAGVKGVSNHAWLQKHFRSQLLIIWVTSLITKRGQRPRIRPRKTARTCRTCRGWRNWWMTLKPALLSSSRNAGSNCSPHEPAYARRTWFCLRQSLRCLPPLVTFHPTTLITETLTHIAAEARKFRRGLVQHFPPGTGHLTIWTEGGSLFHREAVSWA